MYECVPITKRHVKMVSKICQKYSVMKGVCMVHITMKMTAIAMSTISNFNSNIIKNNDYKSK